MLVRRRGSRRPAGSCSCGSAQVSRTRLTGALEGMGLRPREFAVLHHLAEAGASTQLDVARALRIHPSNLVSLLDGMEAGGWLERTRDPADRRRHAVALTAPGRSC